MYITVKDKYVQHNDMVKKTLKIPLNIRTNVYIDTSTYIFYDSRSPPSPSDPVACEDNSCCKLRQ